MSAATVKVELTRAQYRLVVLAMTRVGGEHVSRSHQALWSETCDVLLDAVASPPTCSADSHLLTACDSGRLPAVDRVPEVTP